MIDKELIKVGKISGVFGIKGWVKVFSFTNYREDILKYSPWLLKKDSLTKSVNVVDGALQSKAVIARLENIDDRDQAAGFVGWDIFIRTGQLPKLKDGEYYWSDLVGLMVETTSGVQLGVVDHLLETGSNDVIVIKGDRERAVPFLRGQIVTEINLQAGKMVVDWDPEF